jgi:molybdopterin synthase catalytic subunit
MAGRGGIAMKIIHVAGTSGSGKTTFILDLLAMLAERGSVASVKHLGHHRFDLAPGKDTTVFFETGIQCSVGIDDEKAVFITRGGTIPGVLRELSDSGVEYTVIEGFKTLPYPKVVFGDVALEQVILRNPTVEQVIGSLPLFEDLYTMEGVVRDLRRSCDMREAGCILTFNGIVREQEGGRKTQYLEFSGEFDQVIQDAVREMETMDGILGVRVRHRRGRLLRGEDISFVAVCARHRDQASKALLHGLERLKRGLHKKGANWQNNPSGEEIEEAQAGNRQ